MFTEPVKADKRDSSKPRKDFRKKFSRLLKDASNDTAIESLRRQGYFLGSLLPCWLGTDGLLMQKILKEPDWGEIKVASEWAARILEIVRSDWERSVREERNGN